MSSAGATLQGSFSGETGVISETGFYYGTTSGSLGNKAVAEGTSSPFSKAIIGLTAGTTYYYKAYIIEGGQEVCGDEESFSTHVSATVATGEATSVTQTTAVLNGSYSEASGTVDYTGFLWGTSAGNCNTDVMGSSTSSPFTYTLTGLEEGTTYYYKTYVGVYNASTDNYEYFYGEVQSFTTLALAPVSSIGHLGCLEMPAIGNLSGTGAHGTYAARNDIWYRYNTTNANQQVATHTFEHPDNGTRIRNYTVFYDQSKYAPLWCAHPMHASMWPNKGISRSDNWTNDPAFSSLTQQTGLDNAQGVGYSRGHFVAAQYRKCTDGSMDQTFYRSNQAPQNQSFNGGLWQQIEGKILAAAPSNSDTLYVVTGVMYDNDWYAADPENRPTTLPSGNGTLNVPIPSHFYVCLMKCSFSSPGVVSDAVGCAYLCTNEAKPDNSVSAIPNYQFTIDYVESLTGLDFFTNVPAGYQNAAESTKTTLW